MLHLGIPLLTSHKTDHMLTVPWRMHEGWGAPQIQPCRFTPVWLKAHPF